MCGIVAVFPKKNFKVNKIVLKKIIDSLSHRGPDGEGIAIEDWYGLAHKRLSIIDLKKSSQPFYSLDNRYSITFNGEIYNYLEIRSDLIKMGYTFKSKGDTEVIINAFDKWGIESFNIFEGMFAFVLVDNKKYTAYAVRDQLGIKPLFYLETNEGIVFSSEIKAFLNIKNLSINEKKIYEQIMYRYISGEETIYNDVKRVNAGNYIQIQREEEKRNYEYYNHLDTLSKPTSYIDYEKIEYELDNSIIRHTRSDVGYNIQLSGGLDSSYITALLSKNDSNIRTYSVALEDANSEKKYQDYIKNKYGTKHFELVLNENDFIGSLEKATWHMDMPVIHGACVFLMLLCIYAKETSKVILTGEGADELFLGYSRYIRSTLSKTSETIKDLKVPPYLIPNIWKFKTLKNTLRYDELKNISILGNISQLENMLNKEIKKIGSYSYRRVNSFSFLNQLTYIDQTRYLQSLLERQDRMSMAGSVETRVPFCNVKLFKILNQIIPEEKIKNKTQKRILKQIASKYFPDNFINRKKMGFVLPYNVWLNNSKGLGSYLDLLSDSKFINQGYFNHKYINFLIDEHRKKISDNSKLLLRLIFFEVWKRKFINSNIIDNSNVNLFYNN
ncbi:MAG: asparagine synthase (glutamine-hydrolyzing) [Rhodospirillaceae bacterium]|nr:asparagine synthase (glutamine-hydrolyzing) [Rhodospirillaceae bacterium]|tara:strand:+ start:87179 stop:89020 length:1842 start_codon:yes stop_codon:yes gene_type:complete